MQTIQIFGNIGQNAKVQTVSNDRVAINFTICSNRRYTDTKGEKQSKPTWFDCTIWAKEDKVSQYFTKGRKVALDGHFDNTSRTVQEEGKEKATNIQTLYLNVKEFEFGDKQED